MTIGRIVELVYLRVNGNQPSTDSSLMRVDIRALLPAAINFAMDKTYNLNLEIEGDREYPSEFYATYEDIPINRDKRIPNITLAKGTVPLKGGMGIRNVYDNCGNQYGVLSDSDLHTIEYYSGIMDCMYWYKRTGNKLDLYGVNDMVSAINYQAIAKIEDLSDDDEAPLQAGAEVDVMNILSGWFDGTKQFPYDTIINTKDSVNAATE